ncbi:dipeptidase [Ureibacillus composti]
MHIIDLHCDVLDKLTRLENSDFIQDERLQASFERLKKGNVKVQVFAIFIHPTIPQHLKFQGALKQVEAFYDKILQLPDVIHITDWKQIDQLQEGQIGAVLSLEGLDAIGDDLEKLLVLLNAGVKLVGLTWNYENTVAYGALEDPKKGLKPFAKQVIQLLNERDIIVDVAHLNEQGFYDVLGIAKHLIASHSNSRALCDHTRNLTDGQLRALVAHGGRIHVVFYPPFIEENSKNTTVEKLIEHIIFLKNIVGIENIGLGSDFDGIDLFVENLTNAEDFPNLIRELQNRLSDEEVELIAWKGFKNFVNQI